MIVRLYSQIYNKLLQEQTNVPVLKQQLVQLQSLPINNNDRKVREEINKLEKLIAEREQPERLNWYVHDASKYLNPYHVAVAEVEKLSIKIKRSSAVEVEKLKLEAELVRLKKGLCKTDNKLSMQFIDQLCPERKLVQPGTKNDKKQGKDVNSEPRCKCGSEMELEDSYMYVCNKCGMVFYGAIYDDEKTCSYERLSSMTKHRTFTYKRINHFRETLRQAQGRSNAHIPREVENKLLEEFTKSRIPKNKITPELVKLKLKKIKYSEFFEERVTLAMRFNPDYEPIEILPEQEEELCGMFTLTEAPFDEIKKSIHSTRKNYMSYPLTARRLCQLKGWDHLTRAFPLLKDPKLCVVQDKYWRLVCQTLGWAFIPIIGEVNREQIFKPLCPILIQNNNNNNGFKRRKIDVK